MESILNCLSDQSNLLVGGNISEKSVFRLCGRVRCRSRVPVRYIQLTKGKSAAVHTCILHARIIGIIAFRSKYALYNQPHFRRSVYPLGFCANNNREAGNLRSSNRQSLLNTVRGCFDSKHSNTELLWSWGYLTSERLQSRLKCLLTSVKVRG